MITAKIKHNDKVLLKTRFIVATQEYDIYLQGSGMNEPDFLDSLNQMAEEGHKGARLYHYIGKNRELLNKILND